MPDAQDNRLQITWRQIADESVKLPEGKIYGIPKGGLICALALGYSSRHKKFIRNYGEKNWQIVEEIDEADYLLDDIYDSGATAARYEKYGKLIHFLFDKRKPEYAGKWLQMPWEQDERPAGDAVVRILEAIGEDPKREGLQETPARVVKSWEKLYGGYSQDPAAILSKTFSEKSDEMVVLKNIEMYSTCEHHMLPFFGRCHIAYIPGEKVVGVSKLARLVECFSRRLQIQERLTNQIAAAINDCLQPLGVGVVIEAQHFCMTSRGVEKQNSVMVTSALCGNFRLKEVREEFFKLKEK